MLWWTLRQLSSPDAGKRRRAIWKLGQARRPRTVPHLAQALDDADPSVQRAAASALGAVGGPGAIEALLTALKGKSPEVEAEARGALQYIDPSWAASEAARGAVPEFAAALKDDNADVRASAAWALSRFGDARALEALVAALLDRDGRVTEHALQALNRIDPDWPRSAAAEPVLARWMAMLNSGSPFPKSRIEAAELLGRYGGARAVNSLLQAVADPNDDVQTSAARALDHIDAHWPRCESARRAIPQLVRTLTTSPGSGHAFTMELLERIDPEWTRSEGAREAVPELMALLAKVTGPREPGVLYLGWGRRSIDLARCLGRIGDPRAVSPLLDAFVADDPEVHEAVVAALDCIDAGWRGSEPANLAASRWVAALDDPDWAMRKVAAAALSCLGWQPRNEGEQEKLRAAATHATVVSIVRDDDRPVKANMSLRSEILAGFVVTFDRPVTGWRARLRVRCGFCGGVALDRPDYYLSNRSSGSIGPVVCKSCERYMLSVGQAGVRDRDDVLVFSVVRSAAIPGTYVLRSDFQLELLDISA